jgi:hypothetical protein
MEDVDFSGLEEVFRERVFDTMLERGDPFMPLQRVGLGLLWG